MSRSASRCIFERYRTRRRDDFEGNRERRLAHHSPRSLGHVLEIEAGCEQGDSGRITSFYLHMLRALTDNKPERVPLVHHVFVTTDGSIPILRSGSSLRNDIIWTRHGPPVIT